MEIKLIVSNEKNFKSLEKITDDPAFVVSILKNLGYKKLPDSIKFRLGIVKLNLKNENKN